MERKIKVEKDNVEKEVAVNLLSEYLHLGWTKVEEPKIDRLEVELRRNLNDKRTFKKD